MPYITNYFLFHLCSVRTKLPRRHRQLEPGHQSLVAQHRVRSDAATLLDAAHVCAERRLARLLSRLLHDVCVWGADCDRSSSGAYFCCFFCIHFFNNPGALGSQMHSVSLPGDDQLTADVRHPDDTRHPTIHGLRNVSVRGARVRGECGDEL